MGCGCGGTNARARTDGGSAGLQKLRNTARQTIGDIGAIIVVNSCATTGAVTPNEGVVLDYEVENVGDAFGNYRIEFTADGQLADVVDSSETGFAGLNPGETRSGSSQFIPSEVGLSPGTYTIEANGIPCGTLEVLQEGGDVPSGELVLRSCGPGRSEVAANDGVTVSFEVFNGTDQVRDYRVEITADGTLIGGVDTSETFDNPLDPGESRQTSVTVVPSNVGLSPGTYQLQANGSNCGELTVTQTGTGNGGTDPSNGDDGQTQPGDGDTGDGAGGLSGLVLVGLAIVTAVGLSGGLRG